MNMPTGLEKVGFTHVCGKTTGIPVDSLDMKTRGRTGALAKTLDSRELTIAKRGRYGGTWALWEK